jgi:large subunit ribosomal protein L21
MFAVVKTGGKQYRVAKDDVIKVEKLDADEGEIVALDEVLMVGGEGEPKVGSPTISGAVVEAEVVRAERTRKIIVFKKKRRQNYRRKKGHRQHQTVLKIVEISLDGPKQSGKTAKKAEPKKAEAKKAEAKKAEAKKTEAKKTAKKAAPKKAAAKKAAAKKAGDE